MHPVTWGNHKLTTVYFDGASIAALTAAARLSKANFQTIINPTNLNLYQNTKIDGFEFDSAPLFTLPAVYRDFFQKTGKHFGQVLDVKPADLAFVFNFPDLTINFANLSRGERLLEIERKLGTNAARQWDIALKQGEALWDQIRENYFELEFSWRKFNLSAYLKLSKPRVTDPYLQKILSHYATYLGYPAGIYKWSHILAFVEESFGVWQITGGQGALVAALQQRALELGAKFENKTIADADFHIDATEVHSQPPQRLIGISDYPEELPLRSIYFSESGLTTDVYATKIGETGDRYALVMGGDLTLAKFDSYARVEQFRPAIEGNSDNQIIAKIRTTAPNRFRVRHMDSLAHAGICGELLANAVRGIKNRPNHEH